MAFKCGIPAGKTELAQLLVLEQRAFADLTIPVAVAQAMFARRPDVYCAILGADSTVAAYSIAYPLQKPWADALIAGAILEADLQPHMLLAHDDDHTIASAYVGSVIVDEKFDPLTKAMLLANLLSWRAQQFDHFGISRLAVSLMPVSKQGERMARLIGARKMVDGTLRPDGYPIYGRQISPRFFKLAVNAIERFRGPCLVSMDLNFGCTTSLPPHPGAHLIPDTTEAGLLQPSIAVP